MATAVLKQVIDKALSGDRLSMARLISKIEDRSSDRTFILEQLFKRTGRAQVLGITGPPGAGKSTLVDRLVDEFKNQNKKVAVIAIDPSSPFTGGAILGDRIRMQQHTGDERVFIRSLGTRGKHGGLSHSTKEVVMVLDALSFDIIIVETAGVGQTELDILKLAQTVLVVLVPESGDSIQVMKAGLMEIADVFAINKCDRPEADKLVKEVIQLVSLEGHEIDENQTWEIPVLKTEAIHERGVKEVADALLRHQNFLTVSGKRAEKTQAFLRNEVSEILTELLEKNINQSFQTSSGADVLKQLLERKITPYEAASLISGGNF